MHIHPSILAADFANFESELRSITEADMAHVDVMDNHFVPNLTFGLGTVARLQELNILPLDVHLMITDADKYAPEYAELGVASVTFHLEAAAQPLLLSNRLREIGSLAGVAIKPATPVSTIAELIPHIDTLLIMTVEPGFGGQALIQETLAKVAQARSLVKASDFQVSISVDGGITESNIEEAASLGADTFVAGSAVFKHSDRNAKIAQLRKLAAQGLGSR